MVRSVIQHTAYKTGARGRARNHADYIAGVGRFAGKEDVILCEDGNLPSWAPSASEFFQAADEFEREDKTVQRKAKDGTTYEKVVKGRAYIELEWSIPRGIADPIAWARRVAAVACGQRHVYRLAVHDAPASDGGRNLNMHLMFSDRMLDGIDRSRELFFRRAKTGAYRHRVTGKLVQHDPATGGAKKDRIWNHKGRPKWARKLYERHVRMEIPNFRLEASKSPEPKIGPKLRKAGKEYEARRLAIETAVMEMRALRQEILAIDDELEALLRTTKTAPMRPAVCDAGGIGCTDSRWRDFKQAVLDIGQRDYCISLLSLTPMLDTVETSFPSLMNAMERQGRTVHDLAQLVVVQLAKAEIEHGLANQKDATEVEPEQGASEEPMSPS